MCIGKHDRNVTIAIDVMYHLKTSGRTVVVEQNTGDTAAARQTADNDHDSNVAAEDHKNDSSTPTSSTDMKTDGDSSNNSTFLNNSDISSTNGDDDNAQAPTHIYAHAHENDNGNDICSKQKDGMSRSSCTQHCSMFHGVVRNTFLNFCDDRGRTATRDAAHKRAVTWHPCLCSTYSCAMHEKIHNWHAAREAATKEAPHTPLPPRPTPSPPSPPSPNPAATKKNRLECAQNSLPPSRRTRSARLKEKYLAYANNLLNEGQGRNGPYRTSPNTRAQDAGAHGKKHSHEEIFQTKPVTMMLRNYPRDRTQERLVAELKASVLRDSFDFLYLPTCVQTKTNKGYAFINFKTTEMAEKFYSLWHKTWFPTRMRRPMTVAAAEVQGLEANVRRITEECNAKRITNSKYHPIIYDAEGNRRNIHGEIVTRKPACPKNRPKNTPRSTEVLNSV
eukprot:GEMP01041291.1.p1 GENE.GEMP01041291.1~~GEMP01041291.1.p1  ORF type:complete len:447 (+),score=114.02 GEMP01041291.1:57-1397(+)